MPTGYDLRFVPYTPGGAKLAPKLKIMGASLVCPFSDSPSLSNLSVSTITAGSLPQALEIGVEYNAGSGWNELHSARFMVNSSSGDDTDATQTLTLAGMGFWEWYLQKSYLNHVAPKTITGADSIASYTATGVSCSGTVFTKTGHSFVEGERVRVTNNGGSPLHTNGVYFITDVTTNTFKVTGSLNGSPRANGTHSGMVMERFRDRLFKTGHGLVLGEKVTVTATGGADGITAKQDYYVVLVTSTSFGLSSTINGVAIHLNAVSNLALKAAPDGDRRFNGATVGTILKTFIDEAQTRGALSPAGTPLAYDFTATADSNGVAWASTYTIGIPPGTPGTQVLQLLVKNGWMEYDTTGRTLHAYNPGSGTDQSGGNTPVAIGASAQQRPTQTSLDNLLTDIVTADERGRLTAAYSASGTLPLGRLEAYQMQSGVSDDGTSAAIVTTYAEINATSNQSWVVTEAAAAAANLPEVDYRNGDKIRARFGGDYVQQNVVQIGYDVDTNGNVSFNTTLGYRFVDLATKTQRKIVALLAGRNDTGTGKTIMPYVNSTQPAQPGTLDAASNAVFVGTGQTRATADLSWDAVTEDAAGNSVDVTDYEVWARADGVESATRVAKTGGALTFTVDGLDAKSYQYFSVRGISASGEQGLLSDELELLGGAPVDILDTPTDPALTSTISDLTVEWDGELVGTDGNYLPPAQFAYAKAQICDTEFGTYTDVGQNLTKAGAIVITGLIVGATYWVQLLAVDNIGVASASTSPIAQQILVSSDVIKITNAVGDFTEYAVDGTFENPTDDPNIANWWGRFGGGEFTISGTQFHTGTKSLKYLPFPSGGAIPVAVPLTSINGDDPSAVQTPIREGAVVHVEWWDWVDTTGTVTAPWSPYISYFGPGGISGASTPIVQPTQPGRTWTHHAVDIIMPGGGYNSFIAWFQGAILPTPAYAVYTDDVSVKIKTSGALLIDGSTPGSALAAGSTPATALDANAQASLAFAGAIQSCMLRAAPAGWLMCDGGNYLRTDYPALFAALNPLIGTMTVGTGANPTFTSSVAHALQVGDKVWFTTTGALLTGLSTNTTYTVSAIPTGTTFTLTGVTTSGTQSGVHSMFFTAAGVPDSTHFAVPDARGFFLQGRDAVSTNLTSQALGKNSSKTPSHSHPLSDLGQALITIASSTVEAHRVAVTSWTGNNSATGVTSGTTANAETFATGLQGATDNIVAFPPLLTVNYVIKT